MRQSLTVDVVEVRGDYNKIGREQAKSLKVLFTPGLEEGFNLQEAKQVYREFAPGLWTELEGIAEGLKVELYQVVANFSMYDLPFPEIGCTALVQEQHYTRNYDFSPEIYDARLVLAQPDDGYASVGFSQQAIGRLDGMNEKGLVIGLHFVNQSNDQNGLAAPAIVRIVLDQCQSTDEAIDLLIRLPHSHSYNYSITDVSENHAVVEASPREQHVRKTTTLFCTNHFQADALTHHNRENTINSTERLAALKQVADQKPNRIETFEQFHSPESPLFFKDYRNFFGTLHTVQYAPEDLSVMIGIGQNSDPLEFSFRRWLNRSEILPKRVTGDIIQRD
ncbi:MAG TPA: C45 family peptidase [Bacillales bacterium]